MSYITIEIVNDDNDCLDPEDEDVMFEFEA